jgi:hypothetical protein
VVSRVFKEIRNQGGIMARQNEYKINIKISDNTFENEERKICYYENKTNSYSDSVLINNQEVIISGTRNDKINSDNILETQKSTQYRALIKALIYLYFKYGSFSIENIEVISNNTEIKSVRLSSQLFEQELPSEYENISTNGLFKDVKTSDVVMNSLMHIVLSIQSENGNEFENLWKCFNVLIRERNQQSREATEHKRLVYLKDDIIQNIDLYPKVLEYTSGVTFDYIDSLWIAQMITNNINTNTNAEKRVRELVDSFEDERVLKVLINKIECKKQCFKDSIELYRDEIRLKICEHKKNDVDIVRLLVLKYAYFLRNKFFHAERWPAYFLITNDNLRELTKISEPLKYICIDLINQYSNRSY